ncbi:MFS transporter [Azospirillum halopraeferens]|uniref:MFS transporter n=1 Tax=Azospirillum halopraeferens TaxID=34010 RepID=UPI0004286A69|nr:MFS transporter [Azospirillum halopraeferens]
MSAPVAAGAVGTGRSTAVAAVVAAGIAAAVHVGKAPIAVPLLQADLGIDLATAGALSGVIAVLGLVGGIPAGALAVRAGDRRTLLAGLAALAAGAASGAAGTSLSLLFAARFVEGLGFLLVTVAGPAVLDRVVPPTGRNAAFAAWSCFMPAGMAIAMIAGPHFADWRSLWWGGAGVVAMAGAAVLFAVPAAPAGGRPSGRGLAADTAAVASRRAPLLLAAGFALYSLMFFALFSFLPVLLMQRIGVTHGAAGLLTALATAANVTGNLAAGVLLKRGVGRRTLISAAALAMALTAPGIFLPVLPDAAAFLLCVVFSAVGGLIPATILASAPGAALSAASGPIVVGLAMQGSNLGQVVGPTAIGGVVEAHGWPAAAAAVGAAGLAAMLVGRALPPGPDR